MDSYMIRIDFQTLYEQGVDYHPINVRNDLRDNGLTIVKSVYSSYGSCWFVEVAGEYTGRMPFDVLETKPESFNWSI
jgi:hypothetical protein